MFPYGYFLPNKFLRSLASCLASPIFKTPGFKYNVAVAILATGRNKSFEDYLLLSSVKRCIHKLSDFFKISIHPNNLILFRNKEFFYPYFIFL